MLRNRKLTESKYNEIARLIANGNCVPFLGSGASRGVKGEKGLPGAEELAIDLFKKIKDKGSLLNKWERRNLTKVASLFELIKGKIELDNYIKDRLPPHTDPFKFHKLLSQLPFEIIVTTNWDCLLDNQFNRDKKNWLPIVQDKDIIGWKQQKIILFKIHGCVTRTRGLIISEEDYIKYLSKIPLFHEILKFLFCTKNILFIGYSLSDINIKIILQTVEDILGNKAKIHYLIQNSCIDDDIFSHFNNKGIEIYTSDATEFLEKLIKAFNKLRIEDKIGNKFGFYIDNYRLDVFKFVKDNVLKRFAKDITDGEAFKDDYGFWNQLVETFRNKEDQAELSRIIKEEKRVDIVLKVISQINIDHVSEEVITQLNDLLVRTDDESIRISILKYLYENKKVRKDMLPILQNQRIRYGLDSEMGILLSSVLGETINP